MTPTSHTIYSGLLSAVFYYVSRSWAGTATCFLSGIFIDIDHVFDYWIAKRRLIFTYQDLWNFCGYEKAGRLHLIFHSYELLAALWLVIAFYPVGAIWWGLAIGMTVHMILDRIVNPFKPWVFFFVYRLRHGFTKECVFAEHIYRKMR